jgi:hypothetical protein
LNGIKMESSEENSKSAIKINQGNRMWKR